MLLVVRPPRRAIARAERLARGRTVVGGRARRGGRDARRAGRRRCRSAHGPTSARSTSGLSTQDWGGMGRRTRRSRPAIAAVLAAAGAALFIGLMRRFPRRWWLAGAGAVVAIEVLFVWLAPVVLDPLFNRYEDLPPGPHARGRRRSSRGEPAWTSATCSSWTPRGAPRPPTRTSTGSATRSGWSCTTRCSSASTPRRCGWSWRTSWATSSTATSRAGCCGSRSSRRRGCSW